MAGWRGRSSSLPPASRLHRRRGYGRAYGRAWVVVPEVLCAIKALLQRLPSAAVRHEAVTTSQHSPTVTHLDEHQVPDLQHVGVVCTHTAQNARWVQAMTSTATATWRQRDQKQQSAVSAVAAAPRWKQRQQAASPQQPQSSTPTAPCWPLSAAMLAPPPPGPASHLR